MNKILIILLSFALVNCQSPSKKLDIAKEAKPGTNLSLAKAGLSEKDVVDAYVYVLGRYLVIRQERLDIADKNSGYNKMKYVPLAKAGTVNPNLDVAYSEAWVAVDQQSCQILEVPKISNRYYTVQVLDEWANILTNINERTYPQQPYGKFSFCLKGTTGTPPVDTVRIELPSEKAKLVARVERKGSEAETIRLQKGFRSEEHTSELQSH